MGRLVQEADKQVELVWGHGVVYYDYKDRRYIFVRRVNTARCYQIVLLCVQTNHAFYYTTEGSYYEGRVSDFDIVRCEMPGSENGFDVASEMTRLRTDLSEIRLKFNRLREALTTPQPGKSTASIVQFLEEESNSKDSWEATRNWAKYHLDNIKRILRP